MMKKYRFYQVFDGEKLYFTQEREPTTERKQAGLFTESDWIRWGEGVEREEIGTDEALRLVGAPTLPGLE